MKSAIVFSLFLLACVYSAADISSVSVSTSYKQGHVRFEVMGKNRESLTGLQVIASKEDEPSMNAVYRNGAYEIETQLPVGIADFNLRIRSQEGNTIYNEIVSVVSTVDFSIPSVSVTVDKQTTEITIPVQKAPSFNFMPKSSVNVKVVPKTAKDFVPTTALLVIASPSEKLSLPMTKNGDAFEVSIVPSRADIATPFEYEKGEYEFKVMFGDCLLSAPVSFTVFTATVDFGAVPSEPIYPVYNKPLMYKSENSVKPLKEIEHTFRPENKNPFFLFPIAFSLAILCMVLVLVFLFNKVGFELTKDTLSKKIWKLVYFALLTLIVILYMIFWVGWNMISLLKVLIPLAICTVIVGNRAL